MKRHLSSFLVVMGTCLLSMSALVMGQEISCPRASDEWIFCESRPGLRHTDQTLPVVGSLSYQRQAVSRHLEKEGVALTVDIGTFRYSEREDPQSFGGWLLREDRTSLQAPPATQAIHTEELEQGYYPATFHERKHGTPSDWVFAEADGTDGALYWTTAHPMFWVDPHKLDKLPLPTTGDETK